MDPAADRVRERSGSPGAESALGPAPAGRPGAGRGRVALLAAVLALAVLIIYRPASRYGFLELDDDTYVTGNPRVLDGLTWKGLWWSFAGLGYASNWHPLTWLSHMSDVELFGLRAGGHHLVNILLHAASVGLLFLVLRGMTGAFWRSALVAALFAVHPLHVESVAWVAERKDVLSGLFFMLTLGAYLRYLRRPGAARYCLMALCLALGLLAKPMLVTLPCVLLLLDGWPLGRWVRPDGPKRGSVFLEKAPLLALSVVSAVLTYLAQSKGGLVGTWQAYPLPARLANSLLAYDRYILKMLWPAKLAFFYPHPVESVSLPATVAAGALLVGLTAAAVMAARRRPYAALGWFWYLGTLVPVIGLVQVGSQGMADRYTYLPLVGLFLAAVWGAGDLARGNPRIAGSLAAAALGAILLLSLAAGRQVAHWRDGQSLFAHTLAVTENNWLAENDYGVYLTWRGRPGEAIIHYGRALAIRPDFIQAHNNLGAVLASLGRLDEAVAHYRQAIRLSPGYAEAHYNLGASLSRQWRLDEAVTYFELALRLKPGYAAAHFSLGLLLELKGRKDEAVTHYREALRLEPNHNEARRRLEKLTGG